MKGVLCALFHLLLLFGSSTSLDAHEEADPLVPLERASRQARIASRLRARNVTFHRRRRHKPASQQHRIEAVQNIKQGLVQSGPVELKGHKLTIVALTNDEYVGRYVVASGKPFQADLLEPLLDHITPGSVVVDAGANMGDFTIFFAAATGPTGAVYAFEPQARMFQLLCTNMIINGLLQIVPMHRALSYEPGVLQMSAKVTDGSAEGKAYKEADRHTNLNYGGMRLGLGGESVYAITLDSLNLTNVSVIKVDVQGAEKLVFYGARDTIKRNLPIVAYEPIARSVEENMAKDVASELKLPKHVSDFSIDDFLKELGYTTTMAGVDKLMLPPGKAGRRRLRAGRRMVLAIPPRRR